MFKTLMAVLLVLWFILALVLGINIYRQYRVSNLQVRMLNDLKLISETPGFATAVQDSLYRDANAAESLAQKLIKPFPFSERRQTWLALRLTVILLTLSTLASFWYYYKHRQPQ